MNIGSFKPSSYDTAKVRKILTAVSEDYKQRLVVENEKRTRLLALWNYNKTLNLKIPFKTRKKKSKEVADQRTCVLQLASLLPGWVFEGEGVHRVNTGRPQNCKTKPIFQKIKKMVKEFYKISKQSLSASEQDRKWASRFQWVMSNSSKEVWPKVKVTPKLPIKFKGLAKGLNINGDNLSVMHAARQQDRKRYAGSTTTVDAGLPLLKLKYSKTQKLLTLVLVDYIFNHRDHDVTLVEQLFELGACADPVNMVWQIITDSAQLSDLSDQAVAEAPHQLDPQAALQRQRVALHRAEDILRQPSTFVADTPGAHALTPNSDTEYLNYGSKIAAELAPDRFRRLHSRRRGHVAHGWNGAGNAPGAPWRRWEGPDKTRRLTLMLPAMIYAGISIDIIILYLNYCYPRVAGYETGMRREDKTAFKNSWRRLRDPVSKHPGVLWSLTDDDDELGGYIDHHHHRLLFSPVRIAVNSEIRKECEIANRPWPRAIYWMVGANGPYIIDDGDDEDEYGRDINQKPRPSYGAKLHLILQNYEFLHGKNPASRITASCAAMCEDLGTERGTFSMHISNFLFPRLMGIIRNVQMVVITLLNELHKEAPPPRRRRKKITKIQALVRGRIARRKNPRDVIMSEFGKRKRTRNKKKALSVALKRAAKKAGVRITRSVRGKRVYRTPATILKEIKKKKKGKRF